MVLWTAGEVVKERRHVGQGALGKVSAPQKSELIINHVTQQHPKKGERSSADYDEPLAAQELKRPTKEAFEPVMNRYPAQP